MIKALDHPLIKLYISTLRKPDLSISHFDGFIKKISFHLAIDAYSNISITEKEVKFDATTVKSWESDSHIIIIGILKAGIAMIEPFRDLFPKAEIGFMGIDSDILTGEYEQYYCSIPLGTPDTEIILLDVALATGATVNAALAKLQLEGYENVTVCAVVAAPEGIEAVITSFPNTKIIVASLEQGLKPDGSIDPGLGNPSKRLYGIV